MKFAVEFELPKEQELLVWIGRKFKKTIKTLTKGLLFYLVRTVGRSMVDLENEINKLISYKEDNNIITIEDIDKVCIKSLESHIFDLLIGYGL